MTDQDSPYRLGSLDVRTESTSWRESTRDVDTAVARLASLQTWPWLRVLSPEDALAIARVCAALTEARQQLTKQAQEIARLRVEVLGTAPYPGSYKGGYMLKPEEVDEAVAKVKSGLWNKPDVYKYFCTVCDALAEARHYERVL